MDSFIHWGWDLYKLLILPEPWLPHLQNGDDNSFYFMGFSDLGLTKITFAKDFVQCPEHLSVHKCWCLHHFETKWWIDTM